MPWRSRSIPTVLSIAVFCAPPRPSFAYPAVARWAAVFRTFGAWVPLAGLTLAGGFGFWGSGVGFPLFERREEWGSLSVSVAAGDAAFAVGTVAVRPGRRNASAPTRA